MQTQIQTLLARGAAGVEERPRKVGRGGEAEIAKPQIFNGILSKATRFITVCKLYIRMRLREEPVKR